MPRTDVSSILAIAAIPLLAVTLRAGEPNEPLQLNKPLQPGEHPHDWECAYPISETTCARVIDAWADDNLGDSSPVIQGTVPCSTCNPITMKDYSGNDQTVGYHCQNQLGYEVMSDDLEAKLPIYQQAPPGQGWRVTDWNLHRCLRTWRCYQFCAFDRETPRCMVTTVIGIGRFQPVLDGTCDQDPAPSNPSPGSGPEPGGEIPPDSGYPSDSDTGWY